MAKKRKLNSRNPRYQKQNEQEDVEKRLLCDVDGVKIYMIFKK
tara:strand:+ start:849 stop:977 length:129 start_codon:yes stop_codon:yes gene_type:complete